MTVPYWVQDAIFYQIFPDRFAKGSEKSDGHYHAWGAPPNGTGYYGGDLRGVIQKFDYLLDLGINAVYLNPVFKANSSHRYNTTDYYQIDPMLGTLQDFHALIDVAHSNGVRVILDGVFNHCGRGFFAFNDILENQEESPYQDWFFINHFPIDAYSPGEARDYLAWWKFKSLPKFNIGNPEVRNYLLGVAKYWIEMGADGWRLDVPNEIDDDHFWLDFKHTVRSINQDAYLLGEIWEFNPRWVDSNHFDGLMHYPIRDVIIGFLNGQITAQQFADQIEKPFKIYPHQNCYSMYVPLGTHDTERLYTACGDDIRKVQMAYLFQFAYPGAPAIYYGDEIGIQGGKDPDCRRTFPWDRHEWRLDLIGFVKKLIALRKRYVVLRRGNYARVLTDNLRSVYAFTRILGDEKILVAINASSTRRLMRIPIGQIGWQDGQIVRNLIEGEEYIISGETLTFTLPPWKGLWIK